MGADKRTYYEQHNERAGIMITLVKLERFPVANYVSANNAAWLAHEHATHAVSGWNNTPNEAGEVGALADAIYYQAVRCGEGGELDYSRSVIVAALLDSFVELLAYERGGWDGGTCDSWARAVAEYIGQPME
jgi:hypothetical protein